jgi:hypothetical protein
MPEEIRVKPYVICHMVSSVDGRILPGRWHPQSYGGDLYERLHTQFAAQAWAVGRVTGQEFAKAKAYPAQRQVRFSREPWFARRDAAVYAVVFDAQGKIAWGRSDIGGDPIVAVLAQTVSDDFAMTRCPIFLREREASISVAHWSCSIRSWVCSASCWKAAAS